MNPLLLALALQVNSIDIVCECPRGALMYEGPFLGISLDCPRQVVVMPPVLTGDQIFFTSFEGESKCPK